MKENSAIWQKLKQSTVRVGWCWHPKKTVPRSNSSGLSQLKYKIWTGKTPGGFFHFCKYPGETACMSRDSKQNLLVFSVYFTGNQMNIEKGRKTLGRWDAGCLMSDTVTITSGCLHRMCGEFISSQRQLCTYLFSKIIRLKIMLNEKCAEWVVQKETPKYHLCFWEPRKRKQTNAN